MDSFVIALLHFTCIFKVPGWDLSNPAFIFSPNLFLFLLRVQSASRVVMLGFILHISVGRLLFKEEHLEAHANSGYSPTIVM